MGVCQRPIQDPCLSVLLGYSYGMFDANRKSINILFQEKEDGWTVAFGEMFKCICCPVERERHESKYLTKIVDKLTELESAIKGVRTVQNSGGHTFLRKIFSNLFHEGYFIQRYSEYFSTLSRKLGDPPWLESQCNYNHRI